MHKPVILTTLAFFLTIGADFLNAQEWTRFRGPNGAGISSASTIPVTFSAKDYNWRTELPAGGHSSPVVWGEKIFLTCANDQETAVRLVVCLHAETGKILWKKPFESSFHKKHRFNSFASSTPAVDEQRVYVCWSTPTEYTLLALDHAGEQVWRRDLGPYVSQHSTGTSPIVYKDMIVLGNDQDEEGGGKSFLIAVNRETGETTWRVDRKSARVAYSTPCIYQPEGSQPQLLFNSQAHGVTSLDPKDGSLNWELASANGEPLLNKRSVSSPVITSNNLITASCGSGAGGNYLVAVRPAGAKAKKPPALAYTIPQRDAAPYVPTPLAKDGMLFLFGDRGIVSCINTTTGKAHWVKRTGGGYFGSPVWVNGKIYCINTDGEVIVIAAKEQYKLLAKNPLGELSHSTPAISNGAMYLRTYRHLISIGGKKEAVGE